MHVRGWVACYQGDLNASVRSFEECRDIAVEVGDWHHEVDARLGLGWVLPALGSPDEALAQAQAARALAVGVGNPSKHGEAALVIGGALLEKGDLFGAARSVTEGLEVLRESVSGRSTTCCEVFVPPDGSPSPGVAVPWPCGSS